MMDFDNQTHFVVTPSSVSSSGVDARLRCIYRAKNVTHYVDQRQRSTGNQLAVDRAHLQTTPDWHPFPSSSLAARPF